ncbi:MAG: 7-carboxy-7-deazaguanine synthase QueE, partial [Planctomycetota bacterium]|jgi:7-carboxy-7-deazaguanine synthase
VLADRADYDYARGVIAEHDLVGRCEVILSPVAGRLAPGKLAEWILADGLDVRLGLQLHKIIWPDRDRGV